MQSDADGSAAPTVHGRPKVLVVVGDFPNASETFIFSQIAGLLDNGVDVDVFAEERVEGGLKHEIIGRYGMMARTRFATETPVYRAAALLRSWRVRQWAKRVAIWLGLIQRARRYDVFLCHFGPIGERVAVLKGLGLARGQVWTAFHGYDLSRSLQQAKGRPYPALMRHGDLLLPVSRGLRERLLELGARPERILVHAMGVDCAQIPFRPRAGAGDAAVRILSVARLVEKKGLAYGLQALARLRARRPEAAWDYVVVGDGALRRSLEALSHDLGLADRVRFLGEQGDARVSAELERADVFLLPSVVAADGDSEGIPVSLREAMSSGAAVVSSVHGGIPELVEHGVTGLLAPERDVEALADHLQQLVLDPAARRDLAARARRAIEETGDNRRLNRRLADLARAAVAPQDPRAMANPDEPTAPTYAGESS